MSDRDARETVERCVVRAELRGDPMLGTAFPAARLLLVEQPGPWGRAGLRDSRFDRDVAVGLEQRARERGVRVLAIRRPGRTQSGGRRAFAVVDSHPGHERVQWGSFGTEAELLDLDLEGVHKMGGPPDDRLTYLVCAHSRHDACCALRGRPVAAALAQVRPEQVWECSHVGGERFAANVLVLPSGLLYGRLPVSAVPDFVDATENGELVGPLLRGRIGLPPVQQAALAYACTQLNVRRLDLLRIVGVDPNASEQSDGPVVVRIEGPDGLIDVTVRIETMRTDGLTCSKPGPGSYRAYRPVVVTSVVG